MTAAMVQAEFLRGVRYARLVSLIQLAWKRVERRSRNSAVSTALLYEAQCTLNRLYDAANIEEMDCE